jgi:hypothetical protein
LNILYCPHHTKLVSSTTSPAQLVEMLLLILALPLPMEAMHRLPLFRYEDKKVKALIS